MATKQAEGRTHNGRRNWPSEVATASSRSGRRGMTRLATSRNMGLQGWRPLLSPKPTDPLTTLVGKYLHILCLLRLHGRFYLLILQKRAGRPVDQAVLQLLERLSQQQSRTYQTYQRTTTATPRVIAHEVLPCAPRMPNTEAVTQSQRACRAFAMSQSLASHRPGRQSPRGPVRNLLDKNRPGAIRPS